MTCGRQSATASATACEPSVCLSIDRFLRLDRKLKRFRGGGDILLGDHSGKFLADRRKDRCQRDHAGDRGEPSEERRIRHRAADMLECELAGWERAQPILLD